jgi:hypothetical protein
MRTKTKIERLEFTPKSTEIPKFHHCGNLFVGLFAPSKDIKHLGDRRSDSEGLADVQN